MKKLIMALMMVLVLVGGVFGESASWREQMKELQPIRSRQLWIEGTSWAIAYGSIPALAIGLGEGYGFGYPEGEDHSGKTEYKVLGWTGLGLLVSSLTTIAISRLVHQDMIDEWRNLKADRDREAMDRYLSRYTETERHAIRNRQYFVGMSRQALIESIGYPAEINTTVTESIRREQFIYGSIQYGNRIYIYVENGKVTAFQN